MLFMLVQADHSPMRNYQLKVLILELAVVIGEYFLRAVEIALDESRR